VGEWQPVAGLRFDRLVAVERGEDYLHPRGEVRVRWWFLCDCGKRLLLQPSVPKSNMRRYGSCCCPNCYAKVKVTNG
jgi:hypothetical protein